MITLEIPEQYIFDEATNTFYKVKAQKLHFEHSLAAIAKWETKWNIPFMDGKDKTMVQLVDYIRCMCTDEDVDPITFKGLSRQHMVLIEKYIENPATASWIDEKKKKPEKPKTHSEVMTSELMYFYMSQAQIPYECQYWPLSRLVMLLRIAGEKMAPNNKMSKKDILAQQRALNKARRASSGSKG